MSLYETALHNGSVKRIGDLTIVNLAQGYGSLVLDSMEFMLLRKWAQRRASTEILQRDMQLFLDHIEIAVSRVGSGLPSKGHRSRLERLARKMASAGLCLTEWNLPRDLLDAVRHPPAPELGEKPRRRASDQTSAADAIDYDSPAFADELSTALRELGLERRVAPQ